MALLIQQILSILVVPPGNLVYILVLVFSIAGCLQVTLTHWQDGQKDQAKRVITSLAILLGVQFILFILGGLGWLGIANPDFLLPPVDRAATAICLIWVIWIWVFPEPVRWANSLAIVLSLFTLIGLGFTLGAWRGIYANGDFDALWLDKGWQAFSLGLILVGMIILLKRRPAGWNYGIGFLSLVLVGHLAQLLFPQIRDNFPGAVRLTQLAAFPLLLLMPQRLAGIKPLTGSIPPALPPAAPGQQDQENRRYTTDSKTVQSFLDLALENDPLKACPAITRVICQVMQADLCFLMSASPGNGVIKIEGGYDRVRDTILDGCTLEETKIPLISNALRRGRGLRLPPNHSSSIDMKTLSSLFALSSPASLLAVPMLGPNQVLLGGVLLLLSYSNRVWSADDQACLTDISYSIAQIVQRFHQPPEPVIDPAEPDKPSPTLAAEPCILENDLRQALTEVAHMQNALSEAYQLIQSIPPRSLLSKPIQTLVSIDAIIDHAISLISGQLCEKNITLGVDLPDRLPQVSGNREALQQIVTYLLQNASAITPSEGTIRLKIAPQEDGSGQPPLLIQVTNKGGGISDSDNNRLSSALDLTTSHSIQGIGHPEELVLARALAETQGGKLWVVCEPGRTSTFNLLLTLAPAPIQFAKINSQA